MLVGGELSGNDDFDCIGPVPLRDTLGGGAAIAIGSESYGEVHRCVQIPLWQPRNADCVF